MPMTTTLTMRFEGPDSCRDCQQKGLPVCTHIGFSPVAWEPLVGGRVHVAGLDPAYQHTLLAAEISPDRGFVTLTVETERPPYHDLARHFSTLGDSRVKASIRAVHADTGDTLIEGRYDAPLREGQEVYIGGVGYVVEGLAYPNRNEGGAAGELVDWQVATVRPLPEAEPVTATDVRPEVSG